MVVIDFKMPKKVLGPISVHTYLHTYTTQLYNLFASLTCILYIVYYAYIDLFQYLKHICINTTFLYVYNVYKKSRMFYIRLLFVCVKTFLHYYNVVLCLITFLTLVIVLSIRQRPFPRQSLFALVITFFPLVNVSVSGP